MAVSVPGVSCPRCHRPLTLVNLEGYEASCVGCGGPRTDEDWQDIGVPESLFDEAFFEWEEEGESA